MQWTYREHYRRNPHRPDAGAPTRARAVAPARTRRRPHLDLQGHRATPVTRRR